MSNVTVKNADLPTTAKPSALLMGAIEGLSGEGRMFPEIGIKAARWRIKPVGEGDEQVLNTFNIQFALVGANPAKSKTFYLQKYDPEGDPKAPDCSSDDGVRPNPESGAKQAELCANCEHNVWGSEINLTTGKKNKRCKDSKRLAVMLLGSNEIHAWRLSPTNFMSFGDFLKKDVRAQGVDLDRIVIDAKFDDKATYPHVLFKVARAMTDDEFEAAQALRASEGAKTAVGIGAHVVQAPRAVEAVKVEAAPTPEPKAAPKLKAKPVAAEEVDLDSLLDGMA